MFAIFLAGFLEQGLLVRDTKRLTMVYLKSVHFFLDICSILPFDLFYIVAGYNALFRLNRFFKLWRMLDFFQLAETHSSVPNLFRVGNLILYILILIHWNCCFYFALSRFLGFGTDGWTYPDTKDPKFSGFFKQYVYSFYWSTLTLTTIGDVPPPEHEIAFVFCIMDCLLGVLIFATVFGNVGAMINHMNATRTEFQHKVDAVKRYMEIRKVHGELETRVIKYFDYTWNNKQSIDDKEALTFLPEKLRAELGIHVHMETLRRVAIFQDCEPGLLVELVLKLTLQVLSPGDFICRKGDIGKEMYIVKRGRLQVVSEDGKKIFVTLSDGSVFGEVSILNIAGNKTGNRRTASVRSVGYSDLFVLSKNDLWEALKEYPDAQSLLMGRGKQILRKDKLLDEEAARREEKRQQALVTKVEMILETVDYVHRDVQRMVEQSKKSDTAPGVAASPPEAEGKTENDAQAGKGPETKKDQQGATPKAPENAKDVNSQQQQQQKQQQPEQQQQKGQQQQPTNSKKEPDSTVHKSNAQIPGKTGSTTSQKASPAPKASDKASDKSDQS